MNLIAKIAYVLMMSEFPVHKVREILCSARQVEPTKIPEIYHLLAETLGAYAEGGPDTMRSGRVLQRRKCVEALERIKEWNMGADEEAWALMGRGGDDDLPSIGEYATWVLKHG